MSTKTEIQSDREWDAELRRLASEAIDNEVIRDCPLLSLLWPSLPEFLRALDAAIVRFGPQKPPTPQRLFNPRLRENEIWITLDGAVPKSSS